MNLLVGLGAEVRLSLGRVASLIAVSTPVWELAVPVRAGTKIFIIENTVVRSCPLWKGWAWPVERLQWEAGWWLPWWIMSNGAGDGLALGGTVGSRMCDSPHLLDWQGTK